MVGKGLQLSERQQKLLLGFEALNRAEQRVEILQKFQIELMQKEGDVKSRLGQVEEASFPGNIERSVTITGTSRTEEIWQGRRQTLNSELKSLQNRLAQIRRNLLQTNEELRQAEIFVNNLRNKVLPRIEAEISDL
jgi:predicted  nucleic acid-binding Zn-ribbon protein